MNYSVLMSVYKNEKASNLRLSMESMWRQSIKTDDFVLICDGPLTPELDAVIEQMQTAHSNALNVVRLEKNVGLGHALQIGVVICKNDLIARMDSDDISRFERCEKELAVLEKHPEISVVGSIVEEFDQIEDDSFVPVKINGKRVVPENADEIIAFAKKRNPFNHPSVMFRKADVLSAGNYPDVRYMQDYYLWTQMLIKGYKGYNIQEPLVYMRADQNLFKRRSGKLYRKLQLELFRTMKEHHFISNTEYITSCCIRTCSALAPNWLRQFMFKTVLRQS